MDVEVFQFLFEAVEVVHEKGGMIDGLDGETRLGAGKGFAEDQVDQGSPFMVEPVPGNIGRDQGRPGAFCQVEYADQKIFCQVQVFRAQGSMIDMHRLSLPAKI